MERRSPVPPRRLRLAWDAAIAGVILAGIALIASGMLLGNIEGKLLEVIGWIGLGLTLYGSFIEPRLITVNNKSIQDDHLPALVIAVVSDFHAGTYLSQTHLKRTIDRVRQLQPDIILLPGDFVDHHLADTAELQALRALPAIAPTFAVTGNHDAGSFHTFFRKIPYATIDRSDEVSAALQSIHITVLRNEHRIVEVRGESFAVAGIDDLLGGHGSGDLSAALSGIPPEFPVILLSHNPDIILRTQYTRCNLIVSGHTHGGAICLPGIGPLAPIPDELGRRYAQGIFTLSEKTHLAITRGMGTSGVRARLFCPPEILVLRTHKHVSAT